MFYIVSLASNRIDNRVSIYSMLYLYVSGVGEGVVSVTFGSVDGGRICVRSMGSVDAGSPPLYCRRKYQYVVRYLVDVELEWLACH